MAAWQNAQVASSWTGVGSDWVGSLTREPIPCDTWAWIGIPWSTPPAIPIATGRNNTRRNRSRRPGNIG